MTSARITQRLLVENSLTALNAGLGRLSRSQEQLSSGRIINRPSDSPTGTNEAMRLRGQLAADAQYSRNAQDGLTALGRTDSTLTTMLSAVRRANEVMVQGASTGSNGPEARAALAKELTQIRDGLLASANTQYLGRPIFAGTADTSVAFLADGTYVGDTHPVERRIGEGQTVAVNLTGAAAFTVGGDSLFAVIDDAITQLTTTPAALGGTMARLETVAAQMRSALADVGTRYGRVETALSTLSDSSLDNTAALSAIENVDIARAVVDLQMQEVAYQAALGATARVLQPSLVDFLR